MTQKEKLLKMVDFNQFYQIFQIWKKMGVNGSVANQLKKEYEYGTNKYDVNWIDRLKTFISDIPDEQFIYFDYNIDMIKKTAFFNFKNPNLWIVLVGSFVIGLAIYFFFRPRNQIVINNIIACNLNFS